MAKSSDKKRKVAKIVYTPEEEDWLVQHALQYSCIIENKKTDGSTNRDKEKAWEKITKAFNVAPPGKERTLKSLREKYTKIKQTLRDRAFYFSRDANKNGGGSHIEELPALSEVMQQLVVLLTQSMLGLAAVSDDCDHSTSKKSALQCGSRKIASSGQMQEISVKEIIFDDVTFCLNDGDGDVFDEVPRNTNGEETVKKQPVENQVDDGDLNTTDHNKESILSDTGAVIDRTWDRVNPSKLRKHLNALLQNRRRKIEKEKIPTKYIKLSEEKQQHSENKHKIEIDILEGERERYQFERERAALDLKRAAIECERAELDRERSAIELQRIKNQLLYEKEIHCIRLATFQRECVHIPQIISPVPTVAAKEEYE